MLARPHRAMVSAYGILWLFMVVGCDTVPRLSPSFSSMATESTPSCDCYYTLDCQRPDFLPTTHQSLSICERNWHTSPMCSEDNFESTTKYLDGLCQPLTISAEHFQSGVHAIEAWVQAYEAGGRLGGSPDAQLVRTAQDQILTEREHSSIRSLVFHILSLTVGLTSYPDGIPHTTGFFTMPRSKQQSHPSMISDSHGHIARLNDTYRGALALIREGIIGELTDPHSNTLHKSLDRVRRQYPRYRPFTRCEFPHPPAHGHLFPYSDGIACLEDELRVMVLTLRSAGH